MEAPITASALIHSATLVVAGILLLCKMNYLFVVFQWGVILVKIGGLTALYGSFVALYQSDIKKLFAYSTMSNCGVMVMLSGFGNM
jgi:NADH:ubiquinone oxidoreductase subunit 5 (subunit L)/multisubunit Na+/H+ antiporter MnhA subunit